MKTAGGIPPVVLNDDLLKMVGTRDEMQDFELKKKSVKIQILEFRKKTEHIISNIYRSPVYQM